MEQTKWIPVACAVIHDSAGRLLVARRPLTKALGGKWEFPGGKLHEGETPDVALRREIAEELGITIAVGEKLPSFRHNYESFAIDLIPFAATIVSGTIELREHSEFRWSTIEQLAGFDWAPADIPVVEYLVQTGPHLYQ